jgi:hypothetical protein
VLSIKKDRLINKMMLRLVVRWSPILIAAMLLLLCIQSVPTWARHQDTAIIREPTAPSPFIEGEPITTKVIFSTGDFRGDDHRTIDFNNETIYLLTIVDSSADGATLQPYSAIISIGLSDQKIHEYSRPLPAGYWTVTMEVRDGNSPDATLLDVEEQRFIVKAPEYRVIERQATAEEKIADLTEANLFYSPVIAGSAAIAGAIAGAGVTYFVSHRIERRRERWQAEQTAGFKARIRNLIRHELAQYSEFFQRFLTQSEPVEVGSGGFARNRLINSSSAFWPELLFTLQSHPDHYTGMSAETTAGVFDTEALTRIDESYRKSELFLFDIKKRIKDGGGNSINFSDAEVRELIDLIQTTIELIGSRTNRQL